MAIIARALDSAGDWTFGAGLNDYVSNNAEVIQDISMNLKMFLGDCFFATGVGIDWFNLLGGKDLVSLNLAVNSAILNTTGVTGLLQTSLDLTTNRRLSINYTVTTVFSTLQGVFTYDVGTL